MSHDSLNLYILMILPLLVRVSDLNDVKSCLIISYGISLGIYKMVAHLLEPICYGFFLKVRKIPVPSHRYTPLNENWMKIFEPSFEHLKLQVCAPLLPLENISK